jgi:hypothetical protein
MMVPPAAGPPGRKLGGVIWLALCARAAEGKAEKKRAVAIAKMAGVALILFATV